MTTSTSVLGRLFNSASASLPYINLKAQRNYDSVIEESVTYDLLFSETDTRYEAQSHAFSSRHGEPSYTATTAKSADDRGGLDIQPSRDVRVLVAQKINDVHRVLLDTHPPSAYTPARTSPPPSSDTNGFLRDSKIAGGSGSSTRIQKARTAPHSRQTSLSQTANGILSSPTAPLISTGENGGLFGGAKYRGMTARPTTSEGENAQSRMVREEREEQEDILSCMFGAPGTLSTASTKVHVKPYTLKSPAPSRPISPETLSNGSPKPAEARRSFLFRSTTAENLSNLSSISGAANEGQLSRRASSYVLITRVFTMNLKEDDLSQGFCVQQNGSVKLQEHPNPTRRLSQSTHNASLSKQIKTPTFAVAVVVYLPPDLQLRGMRSPIPVSPSKDRPSCWAPGSYQKVASEAAINQLDDRIEMVMDRLPLLIRALECFEGNATASLKSVLMSQYDGSTTGLRRALQLDPSALQYNKSMRKAAQMTSSRASQALQIRLVVTGQDRWAIWKGVARGVGKVGVGQDKNVFLLRLLTAFLGCHTDWLDLLAPQRYRRQHSRQQRERLKIEAVRVRTVIVSSDKMLARRIIFLLSTFLPSNAASRLQAGIKLDSTPSSVACSGSPQRTYLRSRAPSVVQPKETRTPTFTGSDTIDFVERNVEEGYSHFNPSHLRRSSDALSIRSIAMPIASHGTRKSSVTTTATILPHPRQAIPHFAPYSPGSAISPTEERPGSGGSLAALSLQRTLSRTESNDYSTSSTDSRGKERWDSTRSGFWGNRRGSSTENSEVISSSAEGLGFAFAHRGKQNTSSPQNLRQMVEDASSVTTSNGSPIAQSAKTLHAATSSSPTKPSPPRSILAISPPEPFPLTLSFDEQDGVIDVQYSSSTSTNSPSNSKTPFQSFDTTTSSSYDARTPHQTSPHVHTPKPAIYPPPPVAGHLRTFHPDFALQAIRPYEGLKDDIKCAMRAEPNPPDAHNDSHNSATTTLIADTTSQSLTLLTLDCAASAADDAPLIEHPLSAIDPTLAEALSHALAHSGHSSRAPSPHRHPTHQTPHQNQHPTSHLQGSSLEGGLPRSGETKRLIFGALAKVARTVAAELDGTSIAPDHGGLDIESGEGFLREGVRRWMVRGEG